MKKMKLIAAIATAAALSGCAAVDGMQAKDWAEVKHAQFVEHQQKQEKEQGCRASYHAFRDGLKSAAGAYSAVPLSGAADVAAGSWFPADGVPPGAREMIGHFMTWWEPACGKTDFGKSVADEANRLAQGMSNGEAHH